MSGGDHFYTTNAAERDNATGAIGYWNEGVACFVFPKPTSGLVPLFRLYAGGGADDHFYTVNPDERDYVAAHAGYVVEGIAGYVYPAMNEGHVPLYRLYNAQQADHFYTTDAAERDNAQASAGYSYEGIACYVLSADWGGLVPLYRMYLPHSDPPFDVGDLLSGIEDVLKTAEELYPLAKTVAEAVA